jgi:hypothetical protein
MNLKIGVFATVAGLVGAVLFSQSQRLAAMPELNGAVGWLNSGPLTAADTFASDDQANEI